MFRKSDQTQSKLQKVSPKISSEDAGQIALGRVRGNIIELGLDNYNNRLVYDIKISRAYHREVKCYCGCNQWKSIES